MDKQSINFIKVPSTELPSALLLKHTDNLFPKFGKSQRKSTEPLVDVGMSAKEKISPPLVVRLNDDEVPEILSRLHTYSPSLFPVSQFCRVVSKSDWEWIPSSEKKTRNLKAKPHIWSNLIVGELLIQGSVLPEKSLNSISISGYSACYSYTVGMASLYYDEVIFDTVIDRLISASSMKQFSARKLKVIDLIPIWNLTATELYGSSIFETVLDIWSEITREISNEALSKNEAYTREELRIIERHLREMKSKSIENRVSAFKALLEDIGNFKSNSGFHIDFALAAAAFLVDRGTKHLFLIRRISNEFPNSCFWFSYLAGLAGVESWDDEWRGLVFRISNQLRNPPMWEREPAIDLGWVEFNWLVNTLDDTENPFTFFPKHNIRALILEIFPGVLHQFKLAGDTNVAEKPAINTETFNVNILDSFRSIQTSMNSLQQDIERSIMYVTHSTDTNHKKSAKKDPAVKRNSKKQSIKKK